MLKPLNCRMVSVGRALKDHIVLPYLANETWNLNHILW